MQQYVGDQSYHCGQRKGNHRHPDIIILDVAQLVGKNPFQFGVIHYFQDSAGGADGGVLRVAASGEGVGRRVIHNEDFWHW